MIEEEFETFEQNDTWNVVYQKLKEEAALATRSVPQTAAKCSMTQNRYNNVLPFDDHRVILEDQDCDYINASLVEVTAASRQYILTQGPLEHTCEDFWLMVWQNRCKGVIMLNKLIESKRVKCHQYYPDKLNAREKIEYPDVDLIVTLKSIDRPHKSYIRRTFDLNNTQVKEAFTVYQFQYLDWPDFGVPECTTQFLSFLYYIRDTGVLNHIDDCGPAIVHCSAGIGRSGTFCLVDSTLKMIESKGDSRDIDLRKILLNMRRYRPGLIQTSEQLRFAYQSIIDATKQLISMEHLPESTNQSQGSPSEPTNQQPGSPLKLTNQSLSPQGEPANWPQADSKSSKTSSEKQTDTVTKGNCDDGLTENKITSRKRADNSTTADTDTDPPSAKRQRVTNL